MPKRIDWSDLASSLPLQAAVIEIEKLKSHKITKCQPMTCVVCMDPYPHLMKYQLFACKSTACARAVPYIDCSWRGKLLSCLKHDVASLFEHGKHQTAVSSLKRASMSNRQKEFCKSLTEQRLKPKRIKNLMRHQFDLSPDETPSLRAVQNCVNYHARKNLGNNDVYDDIAVYVRDHIFTGYEEDSKPFMFKWSLDSDGNPYVGDGSNEEPFFVGISTKQLLKRLDRPPESFVLHMDATFKLSQVEYPVFVVGISDCVGSFHLVAVFVVSQRLTDFYATALASLRRVYTAVTSKPLQLTFVMGDAEDGQYSAFTMVIACDSSYRYLMCFFQVLHNAQGKIPSECRSVVLRDIYDMHFSSSENEFQWYRDRALACWKRDPRTQSFAS